MRSTSSYSTPQSFTVPAGDRLGALGLFAHDKDGLAERRSLLLESAAVGHHHVAARHKIVHLVRAQRVDQMHARRTGEELLRVLAHDGAEVHGIDELAVLVPGERCRAARS